MKKDQERVRRGGERGKEPEEEMGLATETASRMGVYFLVLKTFFGRWRVLDETPG